MQLTGPDGRTLSFSLTGPEEGFPVFYCHGIPGSRHETAMLSPDLRQRCRLIAMDRPGYGESSPCAGYGPEDHAEDLRCLAQHLGVTQCAVLGFSGGGVFALAAAAALGARHLVLTGVPAVPLLANALENAGALTAGTWRQALEAPETLAESLRPLLGDAQSLSQAMAGSFSASDRALLNREDLQRAFERNMAAAVAQSAGPAASAMARDMVSVVSTRPVAGEKSPFTVRIVHGREDGLVYPAHACALAEAHPACQLELLPGCGHYGTLRAIEYHQLMPGD
ncbi:MAG: alpha/beta hydrolase [Oleiphilaceae bacterium]|nr:alpha/beta hydrolase [Oleiphilaceae bacterium]